MSDREITTRILPCDNGSGFRFEVSATWTDKDKATVTVHYGEDRMRFSFADWLVLNATIEEAFEFVARKTPS